MMNEELVAALAAERARADAAESESDRLRWLCDSVAKTHGCGDHIKNRIRMEVRQLPTDAWSPYRLRQERDEALRLLATERTAREKAEAAALSMASVLATVACRPNAHPTTDQLCCNARAASINVLASSLLAELSALRARVALLEAVRDAAEAIRQRPNRGHTHECAVPRYGRACDCGTEARWAALRAALDAASGKIR